MTETEVLRPGVFFQRGIISHIPKVSLGSHVPSPHTLPTTWLSLQCLSCRLCISARTQAEQLLLCSGIYFLSGYAFLPRVIDHHLNL